MHGCQKNVSLILVCTIVAALLLVGAVSAAAPTASFSGTPTTGHAPLTVAFEDQSNSSPAGWAWFFGDETCAQAWEERTPGAGWTERYAHSSVALPGGRIVLTGGNSFGTLSNDTWMSEDSGITWAQANASSGWSGRMSHTSVALPDGSIVLMGGGDDTFRNDTWRSTDGGATWTLANGSSGWTARFLHSSVVLPDGSIVLTGGEGDNGPTNDTWRSADNGSTWTEMSANAGWLARHAHSSVALPDGSIVLMGGEGAIGTLLNDVWRSIDNGATWTRQTEHAGWSERYGHGAFALPDGSILLMGGLDDTSIPSIRNDTWRSTDYGATWTPLPDARWPARLWHTVAALPDGSIVLAGGLGDGLALFNDTWRLQPAGSTEQNPTHTYTAPGTYSVTLQVFNADGYNVTQKTGYVTVTAPSRPPASGSGGSTGGPGGYNVGGDSAVSRVAVTGTGISGLIVTGRVQSSPGAGIPPVPGIPYQYIDLVPARFTEITGANITFTVPAAWLAEHNLTAEEVVMYHYNGTTWEALPTTVEGTAGTTVTFMATSPGFSLFAISGIEQPEEAVTTPTAAQTTSSAVAQPTATQTTAAPAGDAAPDFPLGTVALIAGAVLVLIGAGYLIRRWWIRRQNPALFRDYD